MTYSFRHSEGRDHPSRVQRSLLTSDLRSLASVRAPTASWRRPSNWSVFPLIVVRFPGHRTKDSKGSGSFRHAVTNGRGRRRPTGPEGNRRRIGGDYICRDGSARPVRTSSTSRPEENSAGQGYGATRSAIVLTIPMLPSGSMLGFGVTRVWGNDADSGRNASEAEITSTCGKGSVRPGSAIPRQGWARGTKRIPLARWGPPDR